MQYNGRKLPPGWVQCVSATHGRDYFFDTQTGKSVWFAPTAADATGAAAGSGAGAGRSAASAAADDEQQSPSGPPAKRSRQEPPPPLSPPPPPRPQEGSGDVASSGKAKVAVIVPYRDLDPAQRRSAHLEQFVPYMEGFLARKVAGGGEGGGAGGAGAVGDYRVYVVEQSADGRKFNRGKLLNIGFDLARREGCGAFLFHDVDLLPSDELGR